MFDGLVAEAEPIHCQRADTLYYQLILTSSLYHAETISPCSSLSDNLLTNAERLPMFV